MNWRHTVSGLLIILIIAIGSTVWVASRAGTMQETEARARGRTASTNRQTIKQMPILERPNRVGHFYGNTVRRRYSRQTSHG